MDRAVLARSALIAALALLLMLPVSMIRDLIGERQARRNEALGTIALGWGKRQSLAGPYLAVPYERCRTEVTREVVDGTAKERRVERCESLVLRLPLGRVSWSIASGTSERARGIYKARLYSARIQAQGAIELPAQFGLAEGAGRIVWGTPRLVVGVADPRGIRSVTALSFDGRSAEFLPGAGDAALAAGIHAPLEGLRPGEARSLAFSFSLELTGSEAFAIVPLGRETMVAMRADWPHPSFQGAFLPERHELSEDGFSAQWRISRYGAQGAERLAACERAKPCPSLVAQELAVSFIEPVGLYQQLERASKYGFLFIGLTFAAFLLVELLGRLPVHPIQYALVGLALAIFFLVLTALSEHVVFEVAYALAALACTGLNAVYAGWIFERAAGGIAFGAALGALYGVLYMLLRAEDYSLLAGALLLFALLASAMFATRRIVWYRVSEARATPPVE